MGNFRYAKIDDPSGAGAPQLHEIGFPSALCRWAQLVRLYHAAAHVGTLRNWYVRRSLRRLVDRLPKEAAIMDLGCGAGDHLFYAWRRRPDLHAVGIDRSAECVEICRLFGSSSGTSAQFIHANLEDAVLPPCDLALCITTLQYVDDDRALLKKIRSSLVSGGRVLIYSPIRNERITSFFRRYVEPSVVAYDSLQERRRVYDMAPLIAIVEDAGLAVEYVEQAYGTFGKMYFEVYETLLHGLKLRGWRYAAMALLLLSSPVLIALMIMDRLLPVRRGNGLLIVAG